MNQPSTFHQLHTELWERMVDLCLAQIANRHIRPIEKEARTKHEKVAVDMRESLEYRFSAAGFHAGLLRDYQRRALDELAASFLGGNPDGYQTVYTARRRQQMLFDSVIFNILALFDYIGNAIGFSFYGADAGGAKWKWKRAVQFARDPTIEERQHGQQRYSGSSVAPRVSQVHHEWIHPLEEYRAELIHYKTDPAGGGHSFQFERDAPLSISLSITTPSAFTKWVRIPGKRRREPVLLLEATDWLILQTHSSALAIIDSLTTELEREPAPPDGGLRVVRRRPNQ